MARAAGRKIAFTLSDGFVIERHRDDFMELINSGLIDILFSNEAEIQALAEVHDFEKAVAAIAAKVPVLVSTRSEKGAIASSTWRMRYEVYAAAVEPSDRHDRRGRSVRCRVPRRLCRGREHHPVPQAWARCARQKLSRIMVRGQRQT
jgi:sugar/nucleoside kinase (ribokinase family)